MDRVSKSTERIQANASTLPSPKHRKANRRNKGKQRVMVAKNLCGVVVSKYKFAKHSNHDGS